MFENHKNVFKIVIILRGVLKFKFCYWYTQRLKIMEVDLHLFDYLGLDIQPIDSTGDICQVRADGTILGC